MSAKANDCGRRIGKRRIDAINYALIDHFGLALDGFLPQRSRRRTNRTGTTRRSGSNLRTRQGRMRLTARRV